MSMYPSMDKAAEKAAKKEARRDPNWNQPDDSTARTLYPEMSLTPEQLAEIERQKEMLQEKRELEYQAGTGSLANLMYPEMVKATPAEVKAAKEAAEHARNVASWEASEAWYQEHGTLEGYAEHLKATKKEAGDDDLTPTYTVSDELRSAADLAQREKNQADLERHRKAEEDRNRVLSEWGARNRARVFGR